MKKISATEFKAKCLKILDDVHDQSGSILITKHGRVVARLVGASEEKRKPWEKLQNCIEWKGDPFEPVLKESEIEVLK